MQVVISVSVAKALQLADSQAGFTHGWKDFRPTGLVFYQDGGSEAIFVPDPQASVRDVALATGRAARTNFKRVAGIGVMCAAWASKTSVEDLTAPAKAADRARARIIYAVDVEGIAHTFTNVAGERHHEYAPVRECDPIPAVLSQVLAEATFSSWYFCPTGTHERTPIL